MNIREVRFERDETLDHIEVVIRAREENEEVAALLRQLCGTQAGTVAAFDGEGGVRRLREEEIISASAEGKLVSIETESGVYFTRRSLQSLEDALDENRFLRISRYELVNLDKVVRYDFTAAGMLRLELVGGGETWASRRNIPAIRRRLKGGE